MDIDLSALRAIERDKEIPFDYLVKAIEDAMLNAYDKTEHPVPGARVELRTSAARGEHGELLAVRLAVVDNGPGFADKVLKRAFEPYVTTKSKGTGLGLAVVKKIADEHGARLRVANLHAGDAQEGPVTGARVSLSFSTFASPPGGTGEPGAPGPAPAPR